MSGEAHRAELIEVIKQVRTRWRLKLAARGAAIVISGTTAALLLSASGLQALRFTPGAIIGFRLAIFLIVVGLLARWIVAPLRRRVRDGQVALYLEERDPSLQADILSAVEAAAAQSSHHSPALVDRLVALAVERCRALDDTGRTMEHAALRRHAFAISGVLAAAVLLIVFGPGYLRHGVTALLVLSRSAEAASPYRIEVRPGTVTVPRGSDHTVSARLVGFSGSDAVLIVRGASGDANGTGPGGDSVERVPLVPAADPAVFDGMLFHLERPIQYYVESEGVRSPTYSMTLVDLPAARRIDIEYRFPAYTGLSSQRVEGGGDVAALRGTEVVLRVVPTMKTAGGRIVLNESSASPLAAQSDGSLTGSFTVERQGFYRIELQGPHGERVAASPQYTIDVIADRPPSVSITKPSRDTSATAVEELFVEARAEDDFGVKQLQLLYSVNGGPEKSVTLQSSTKSRTDVSAGHALYLEELGLKPGDVVSYYARATDNDAVQGPKTATSDIYFVQIRPFNREFKPAPSQAQGGGAGASDVGALSKAQKEVVAGTFNTVRDRAKASAEKYRQNVVFLTLAQAKVRQRVDDLSQKMSSRQIAADPAFAKIAGLLPQASTAMRQAEADLQKQAAKEALSPEQRALQLLQEAEQEYELQVSASRNGGGGGPSDSMAEDLADLFALELDKLANQYEMQQRADQQAADRRIDEIAEKLKELARRQLAEAERQRRMAASGQNQAGGGGGGGASQQRALADEAEQAARRLEQLTRDEPRQDLREAARRLQEAADAMRRAAANASRDGGAQATAAEARLKEALDRLARTQGARGERNIQGAKRQAEELATEQRAIASEVQGLDQAGAARGGRVQTLAGRKDAMEAKLSGLEQQLQQLADDTRAGERDASRKLQEAAGSVRDNKIKEKIRYSKGMLQGQSTEYAKAFEQNIGENLDALRNKIGEAANAMAKGSKQGQLARTLEQTRDLVRGMQSLAERAQAGQAGQRGQNQSGGQSGQQAQGGQQGQGGQQSSGQGQGSTSARSAGGPPQGGGAGADARPDRSAATGDAPRQFARELRELTASAEDLRRRLAQAGVKPGELDAAIRDLREMDLTPAGGEPRGIQQLLAAVDRLKRFEFDLRKKVGTEDERLFLSGSDEVPAGFRDAIEEYYRALAKKSST